MSLKPDTRDEIYRHLRDYRDQLMERTEVLYGEISDGRLMMMMSPVMAHQRVANRLRDQLITQGGDSMSVMAETDLEDPALGVLRIPDLCVIPRDVEESEDRAIPADQALVVIEIVSPSNSSNDYRDKVRDYARMRIAHYLIVDPRDGTCVHYWQPAGEDWDNRQRHVFGDVITVGDFTLDTGGLTRYRRPDGS
ncbi:Uma2 family endonuclease [Streptomyces sp. NPDC051784]|uniref:Uma2 family endonuclease n=1 Tax=Streptomyces sp. NPDC051784 TaxID=3155805 RepID=UPI003423536C